MTHPPHLLIHNSKLKTTKQTTLYACEYPKVSIVIYQRGKGKYAFIQQFLEKTHNLPFLIEFGHYYKVKQASKFL